MNGTRGLRYQKTMAVCPVTGAVCVPGFRAAPSFRSDTITLFLLGARLTATPATGDDETTEEMGRRNR